MWNTGLQKEQAMAMRSQRADLGNAAAAWWYNRLECYEMVVSKNHYIQHPRDICWLDVYEDEFVPQMNAQGLTWRVTRPKRPNPQQEPSIDDDTMDEGGGEADEDNSSNHDSVTSSSSWEEVEGRAVGSISSWYRGRAKALKRLAVEHLGEDHKPFKFVSRAQHSAYVSCGITSNSCIVR